MTTYGPHPAALDDEALEAVCDVTRARRSGPGGQRRNKVETAVVLVHRPTNVRAEAAERRSAVENRRVALRRLRINLALAVRAERPADGGPSSLWRSRCRNARLLVNPGHADFASLLAEALDAIAAAGSDVRTAAGRLGCTMSQLVKLLKIEARALAMVNAQRAERGLPRLR